MTPLLFAIAAAALSSGDLGQTPIHAGVGPVFDARPEQQQPAPKPVTSISADVIVLHGTNDNSGIDPKIGKMPALSKPPFSSYNSYKLLDGTKLQIEKGKSASFKLPTGRDLLVTFKDVIQPAKQGDSQRFVVAASIQKPDGKSFLPNVEVNAKAGEWFFVGGQDYKGGSLVIGIKLGE